MKKLLLLMLISQTTSPMLSLIKTFLNQAFDEFSIEFQNVSNFDLNNDESSFYLPITQLSKPNDNRKEISSQKAIDLAARNNQMLMSSYFQQLKTHFDSIKEKRAAKNFALKQELSVTQLKEKNIKTSEEEDGFVYIQSPRSSLSNASTK